MPAMADRKNKRRGDQGRRAGRRPRRGRWGRVRVLDRRRCRDGLGGDRQRHGASRSTRRARSPISYPGGPAATLTRHLHQHQQRPGLRDPGLRRRLRPAGRAQANASEPACTADDFALVQPGRHAPRRSRPGPACRAGAVARSSWSTAAANQDNCKNVSGHARLHQQLIRATRSGPVRRAARVTGPERTSHGTPTNRGDVRWTARAAGGAARSAARRRAVRSRVASLRRASVRAARRHPGGARPAAAPPRRQGEGHRCGPRSAQPGHVGADRAQLPEPEQAPGPDEPRPGQDHRNHRAARGRSASVHHGGLRGPADAAADPHPGAGQKRTTDLAAMRVPIETWPWLTMLNRPLNQDGCKGAEMRLKFKARGLRQ